MLHLVTDTDPQWTERVARDLPDLLLDHAHCEKKAASMAVNLIFRYPEHAEVVREMADLGREELAHFKMLLDLLDARGVAFRKLEPSPYAAALMAEIRSDEPAKLVDTLLCCGLIEARSCERMKLLRDHLDEEDVVMLYGRLLESEARHHALFVRLAESIAPSPDVHRRLRELAIHEAGVIAAMPNMVRMHT